MKRRTTPTPPAARGNLYLAHLAAFVEVLEFLSDHWTSFTALIPDGCDDGVAESDACETIRRAATELWSYAHRVVSIPGFTDDAYRALMEAHVGNVEYVPLESLATMVELSRAEDRRRQTERQQTGEA